MYRYNGGSLALKEEQDKEHKQYNHTVATPIIFTFTESAVTQPARAAADANELETPPPKPSTEFWTPQKSQDIRIYQQSIKEGIEASRRLTKTLLAKVYEPQSRKKEAEEIIVCGLETIRRTEEE
ncbi:hypothetical protein QBC40DRAFT_296268 [Triangularia verruculosa]|uniref:Uncharacterized protein n=1 Tax=Triangularia verruculosa TaxID=2587418 RepID=A0AAN6XMZ6_9PEZI|nr:hypothetical protein QBC40DRAFT_296268 [Triangularia verruculosa]